MTGEIQNSGYSLTSHLRMGIGFTFVEFFLSCSNQFRWFIFIFLKQTGYNKPNALCYHDGLYRQKGFLGMSAEKRNMDRCPNCMNFE